MKNTFLLSIILVIYFGLSCVKVDDYVPPVLPPEPNPSMLNVVWQSFLDESKKPCTTTPPILYNNTLIIGAVKQGELERQQFKAFSVVDGTLQWAWIDWNDPVASLVDWQRMAVSPPYLYAAFRTELHKMDMQSGQSVWTYFRPAGAGGDCQLSNFGDYLFTIHDTDGYDNTYVALVKCQPEQFPVWDTIFSVSKGADNFSPNLYPPSMGISPAGDTLLVFQNRSGNFSTGAGRIELYCFNLSADSLFWKTIPGERNSNAHIPLVEGNLVYLQAATKIFCFDLMNGQIRWVQDFGGEEGFLTTNLLIVNDKLIAGTNGDNLYAVDKITGQIRWLNKNSGSSRNFMVEYQGKIYFTAMGGGGKLYCVNAESGITIFSEVSPNVVKDSRATFNNSEIAIDKQNGLLYTDDTFFALCIRLPQ